MYIHAKQWCYTPYSWSSCTGTCTKRIYILIICKACWQHGAAITALLLITCTLRLCIFINIDSPSFDRSSAFTLFTHLHFLLHLYYRSTITLSLQLWSTITDGDGDGATVAPSAVDGCGELLRPLVANTAAVAFSTAFANSSFLIGVANGTSSPESSVNIALHLSSSCTTFNNCCWSSIK